MAVDRKLLNPKETIFGLASGALPSAVAIVKLSGPRAFEIARRIFRPLKEAVFTKKGLEIGLLLDLKGNRLDEIVLLKFRAPHSQTGEDIVEFQIHGSRAVFDALNELLVELGARPAKAGEFSYRALIHGKATPNELDSLGDLFLARRVCDLSSINGARDEWTSNLISKWRDELIKLQAIFDTAVDFSEEHAHVVEQAGPCLEAIGEECCLIEQRYKLFVEGSNAPRITLVGLPNAGKSSLFNALLCRYRAIVDPAAGTTRDVIEEDIEVEGFRWRLVDTAGIRESQDEAEKRGIQLGESYLKGSSFWMLLIDGSEGVKSEHDRILTKYSDIPHFMVWTKADLPQFKKPQDGLPGFMVSSITGIGIEDLWNSIRSELSKMQHVSVHLPRRGEVAKIREVHKRIGQMTTMLKDNLPAEILAEQTRELLLDLEGVLGVVTTDDVLDRLFGEFCIGK